MKYIISIFFLISTQISVFSQSQIPNGDFETWTSQYVATGWNSFNFEFPLYIHTAVRTSDSNQGSFAAELITSSSVLGIIPGLITLGVIDSENITISGGIPFPNRPTGISYYFKYSPVNNDSCYMLAVLTKWNTNTLQADTIGMTAYFSNYSIQDYTKVSVPFVYISEEIPDTLNVIFVSSGFEGHAGSNLKVDDVSCEYGTVVSPTLCFPAVDISSSEFTANWLPTPDATSYSMDVSLNPDFSSYIPAYEDFDNGSDTFCVVNVNPGLYYYRVRVHYNTDVSINSNRISVPTPTNAMDAGNINATYVQANWESALNASNYFIDVAQDIDFTNYVSGFENRQTGNTASYIINGLQPVSEYFYRIRVVYNDLTSDYSNTVSFTTGEVAVENINQLVHSVFSGKNELRIVFEKPSISSNIKVFDLLGRALYQNDNPNQQVLVDNLIPGMYILVISDHHQNNFIEKILVY